MRSFPLRNLVALCAGTGVPLISFAQVYTFETTDKLPNLYTEEHWYPASYYIGSHAPETPLTLTTIGSAKFHPNFTADDFQSWDGVPYKVILTEQNSVKFDHFDLQVINTGTLKNLSAIEFNSSNAIHFGESIKIVAINTASTAERVTAIDLTAAADSTEGSSFAPPLPLSIELRALISNDTPKLGQIVRMTEDNNNFILETKNQSLLIGNIEVENDSNNTGSLTLGEKGDTFIGNIFGESYDSDSYQRTDFSLSLEPGTIWKPTGKNAFTNLTWKQGAIIDLTPTEGIFENTTLTPEKINLDVETITVENNAILRIAITDDTLKSKTPYINLANENRITDAHVLVDFVDLRTNLVDWHESIPFISADYDSGSSDLTFEGIAHEFETGLGRYETNIIIGPDDDKNESNDENNTIGKTISETAQPKTTTYSITSIQTQLIGPSRLAENFVDTLSSTLIATENVISRTQSRTIERLLFPSERGLWVDAGYSKTKLSLADETRTQKLKTHYLTMGWDKDFEIPFMHKTFGGVWFNAAKNDINMHSGNAESDYYGAGIYVGGLTPQKEYRLLFQAHVGKTDTEFNHVFPSTHEQYHLNSDAQTYGLGLYVGFNRYNDENPQASPWMWEPFMSGHTYWVDPQTTSLDKDVRFKTEKNHQSVVRAGITVAFDDNESLKGYVQVAAAHRFGKSVTTIGGEKQTQHAFQTEELQETWGELSLFGAYRYTKNLEVALRTTLAQAKEVKPEIDFSLSVQYRF